MPVLPGPNYKGWRLTDAADALEALWAGVSKFSLGSGGVTIPAGQTLTVDGTLTTTGAVTSTGAVTADTVRLAGAGFFGLGTPETVTLVSGVATVTRPYVILDAEGAGTTDTLDSITYTGQAAGDLLLLTVNATDTITADNSATLLLGAATRAIAPGGSLLLLATSATVWTEIAFLTAAS